MKDNFCLRDIKVGDFFFEATSVYPPQGDSALWMVSYIDYEKYGTHPLEKWVNSAGAIRQLYPAEMAVQVMLFKRQRFKTKLGQYDPFYGFAPVGTALRKENQR